MTHLLLRLPSRCLHYLSLSPPPPSRSLSQALRQMPNGLVRICRKFMPQVTSALCYLTAHSHVLVSFFLASSTNSTPSKDGSIRSPDQIVPFTSFSPVMAGCDLSRLDGEGCGVECSTNHQVHRWSNSPTFNCPSAGPMLDRLPAILPAVPLSSLSR